MLAFVHIEKTAGTSLKFIFRNSFGLKHCDSRKNKKPVFTQEDLDYAKKVFGEIKCISGHNLVQPTKHLEGNNIFFLTFLRDPIVRSASFYQDHCLRGSYEIRFEDWMKDAQKHNMQTKRIAGEANLIKAKSLLENSYSFVGLTERFDDSLKLLQATCPEKLNLKYNKKLIAPNNKIKHEILASPEKLKILQDANQLDIELYDFVKKDLFPRRLSEHQKAVSMIELPKQFYKTQRTLNYQLSIAFNKFVYRQLLKVKGKLAPPM